MGPVRRIHSDGDLADLAESLGIPAGELERDFLLVNVAAQLENDFPGALCFKGGFVLRHVHGQSRLSEDIDATRHDPPRHKLDAGDVARSIVRAGGQLFSVRSGDPETDSAQSLDFNAIRYTGPLGRGTIAVEVSYREALVLGPVSAEIGHPFYEPFPVPVMAPEEIVAEKLRTLAQRRRPTDLSDVAFLLTRVELDDAVIRRVAVTKFKPGLVAPGDHGGKITANIAGMADEYTTTIHALVPEAPEYAEAAELVLSRLRRILPE